MRSEIPKQAFTSWISHCQINLWTFSAEYHWYMSKVIQLKFTSQGDIQLKTEHSRPIWYLSEGFQNYSILDYNDIYMTINNDHEQMNLAMREIGNHNCLSIEWRWLFLIYKLFHTLYMP